MLNVSKTKWIEGDIIEYFLLDEYTYTDNRKVLNEFVLNQKYCDSIGEVYLAKKIIPPKSIWRKYLKFLPNVYKCKIIFEETGEKVGLEDLKSYLLEQVNSFQEGESRNNWIKEIKNSKSYTEIISSKTDYIHLIQNP